METEDELAGVDFTPYSRVGVTAGASTPSWSIDRVMAYLKTLEDQSRAPVLSKAKRVLEALVVTSAYTSIAAGVLCYVAALLQGIPFRLSSFALVFCYVLAMHVLNRFTERNLDRFRDDPVRARFYEKNKRFMQALGVGSALAAVAVGFYMGVLPFLLVLAASILGILYSVKIVPKRVTKYVGFRRLKDIAASKNFFVASAWAVVSVFPLFFLTENAGLGQTLLTFFFLFLVTGIRSVVVDLTDMNADRLVGRETIPLVFGEKKTKQALLYGCAALGVLLIAVAGVGIFPPFAWILGLVVLAETIFFHYRGFSFDRVSVVRRDFLVDTHFLAAGLVALEWTLFV
ncbi:MAG: UbiA family prenyltransferase [Deltaproteobacteria bacterium]|nr:UbiA family prenyltransferase [Deltaproteobacteria bacterium]